MNPETTWLMRLVRPGALEFEGTIGWRIGDDPQILVDGRHLEGTAVWTLEKMASILGDLGLGGPALISLSLEGVEDVILTRARPGGRKVRLPNIELPVARAGDIALPLAEALQEQFDMLWQAGGWEDGSPSFEGEHWAGYDTPRPYSRS